MLDIEKYKAALEHESPDAVLGSIMNELKFPKLDGIGDACDIANSFHNKHDLNLIDLNQPMFFNYQHHRLINKQDVLNLLKQFK